MNVSKNKAVELRRDLKKDLINVPRLPTSLARSRREVVEQAL